jgi:endonuclease/exonuclease/phosphatase family metal-dependent hydrolase
MALRLIPLLLVIIFALSGRAADPPMLRVLTYNIHHGEGTDGKIDLPRLARVIADAKPDLVALQEVDRKTRRSKGVDQTAELARLTGLHGKFAKQLDYDGGEYGQAILSRFPLPDDPAVHWLPGTPDRERRIAGAGRVRVGERTLTFVTTHLHHARPEFREQQAARLIELFAKDDNPVVLAGDLNATPDEKPIALLSAKWQVAPAGATYRTYPAGKPTKQLDYVLCRPGTRLRVREARVIDEAVASDHRPVLAVLEWVGK